MRPNVSAMPTCVTVPCVMSLMMIAPVPAKTRANVPTDSASSRLILSPPDWLSCPHEGAHKLSIHVLRHGIRIIYTRFRKECSCVLSTVDPRGLNADIDEASGGQFSPIFLLL